MFKVSLCVPFERLIKAQASGALLKTSWCVMLCTLQACATCDLEALSASGSCLPGSYTLAYSVSNDAGITATVERKLVVYQAAAVSASFVLWSELANTTQVQHLVADLQNNTKQAYADGISLIVSKLTASVAVDTSDVDITSATSTQHSPTNYSVAVNSTVFIYTPSGIHRGDIQASSKAIAAAGATRQAGRRRLHQVDDVDSPAAQRPALSGMAQPGRRMLATGELRELVSSADNSGSAAIGAAGGTLGWSAAQALGVLQAALQHLGTTRARQGVNTVATSLPLALYTAPGHSASSTSRQLLQVASPADQTLQGSLQSLVGALTAQGVANFTTQAVTSQNVDLVTVRLNNLLNVYSDGFCRSFTVARLKFSTRGKPILIVDSMSDQGAYHLSLYVV